MRIPTIHRRLGYGLLLAGVLGWLAGCASTGIAPVGSGGAGAGAATSVLLTGTLANVDHSNQRLLLAADDGSLPDLAYDENTRVYAPASLKPGDRIRVQATRVGRLWHAHSIDPAVGGGADSAPADQGAKADTPKPSQPATDEPARVQGVISAVDVQARMIEFTEGGVTGSVRSTGYDADTEVEFQGAAYPVKALQRGDLISLQLSRSERGWVAKRIVVQQRASDH